MCHCVAIYWRGYQNLLPRNAVESSRLVPKPLEIYLELQSRVLGSSARSRMCVRGHLPGVRPLETICGRLD